jgi:plasmid stability protein
MATIRVRDLPNDVVAVYRRRAAATGRSLESYLREKLIAMARRQDKAEVMVAFAADPGPCLGAGTTAEVPDRDGPAVR